MSRYEPHTDNGLVGRSRNRLKSQHTTYEEEGRLPTSSRPLGSFRHLTQTMAPLGDLGIDHDQGPLPGPSETYGAPTTLGFTSDRCRTYECLRTSWPLLQVVPWVYLGCSQWRGRLIQLDSLDSLSLSRKFTAIRRNHSTRLFGLFEPIWNIHNDKEESFDSTPHSPCFSLEFSSSCNKISTTKVK